MRAGSLIYRDTARRYAPTSRTSTVSSQPSQAGKAPGRRRGPNVAVVQRCSGVMLFSFTQTPSCGMRCNEKNREKEDRD